MEKYKRNNICIIYQWRATGVGAWHPQKKDNKPLEFETEQELESGHH
jgi:hypothetical protein